MHSSHPPTILTNDTERRQPQYRRAPAPYDLTTKTRAPDGIVNTARTTAVYPFAAINAVNIANTVTAANAINTTTAAADLKLPTQTISLTQWDSRHAHLKRLPVASYANTDPKLLIGVDNSQLVMPSQVVASDDDKLIASKTRLGWVVYGQQSPNFVGASSEVLLQFNEKKDEMSKLHELVSDLHTTENFGIRLRSATYFEKRRPC